MSIKCIESLKEHILSEDISKELIADLEKHMGTSDLITLFLSVCNQRERARVFHGRGSTLEEAWENAEKRLSTFLKREISKNRPFFVKWAKVDFVYNFYDIPTCGLNEIIVACRWHNFSRVGISFDKEFKYAFLEAELNGNKIISYMYSQSDINAGKIDYTLKPINLDNLNYYLKEYYDLPGLSEIPDDITVFNTQAYFCDENNKIYELYDNDADFGRRRIDFVDGKVIGDHIIKASEYLTNLIDKNGKFIYGYFPIFGSKINNYNIVRHISSLWSIINLYRMTRDETLVASLERAVTYIDDFIVFKDDNTAFIVESDTNEFKLGSLGVALIMYTEYMDVFGSDKYVEIVKKLANAILSLQNKDDGTFTHVLNSSDYSVKDEFRTVYYDGEATFGLARAYSCTKDERFLSGAINSVERFIRDDYTKHRDHWVSYSLNEITKYVKDKRYFEFALDNVHKNLKGIYKRETSYHTYLELLMTGWQTYKMALDENIDSEYITGYNPEKFAQTIYHRARHMLNGYFYPEYAMYMKYPNTIVDSFQVRHHSYRVRIDDIQHFIGGYYFYSICFDDIRTHLSDEFLAKINS